MANLHFQLSWYNQITLLPPPTQHHSFFRNFHPLLKKVIVKSLTHISLETYNMGQIWALNGIPQCDGRCNACIVFTFYLVLNSSSSSKSQRICQGTWEEAKGPQKEFFCSSVTKLLSSYKLPEEELYILKFCSYVSFKPPHLNKSHVFDSSESKKWNSAFGNHFTNTLT